MPEGQTVLTHCTIMLWALKIRRSVNRPLNWRAEESRQVQKHKHFGWCFFEDKAMQITYPHIEDTAGNRTSQTGQKTE